MRQPGAHEGEMVLDLAIQIDDEFDSLYSWLLCTHLPAMAPPAERLTRRGL
jgi:hypothetical protein